MKKYIILFSIALVVKLFMAFYLLYLIDCQTKPAESTGGFNLFTAHYPWAEDTMRPIENYLSEDSYYRWNGKEKVYAGRLPHYGIIYYLFRLFFDMGTANFCMSLFQIIVECISIILLCLLTKEIFKSEIAFYWVYFLLLISTNSSVYGIYVDPISLSISVLYISLFLFYRYLNSRKNTTLLAAGILFSFVVCLRPYMGLFYIFFSLLILWNQKNLFRFPSMVFVIKHVFLFFFPFVLMVLPWTIRNYSIYHKFVPLQINLYAGENYTEAYHACNNFVTAWGGNLVGWDKRSAGCYFEPPYNVPFDCEFEFPDYVFTREYSMKEIEEAKNLFVLAVQANNDSLDNVAKNKFDKLTAAFIKEKPFRYHILSPLILAKTFLFHSGSYYLPIGKLLPCYKSYQMAIKALQSLLYYFTLIFGMIGLVYISVKNKNNILLLAVPVILIVFFAFVIRKVQFQYFAHSYGMLVIGSFIVIRPLLKRILSKKHISLKQNKNLIR